MGFSFTLAEPTGPQGKWSGVIDDVTAGKADFGVAHFFLIDFRCDSNRTKLSTLA